MIYSLYIANFQSHKETQLTFDPGVNVIIGPTDSGKSAILRAMNWVINNRPTGDTFKSNWGGDVAVDIEIDNDIFITREKGKQNLYVISTNKASQQPMEFKAIGANIPNEIQDELKIKSINYQFQHDPPFLLSSSSGEVARYLNAIVNLDSIDSALGNIARMLRSEQQALGIKEQTLAKINEDLKEYEWISNADGELTSLEHFERKVQNSRSKFHILFELTEDIRRGLKNKSKLKTILKYDDEINSMLKAKSEIAKIKGSIEILTQIYNQAEKIDSQQDLILSKLKLAPDINSLMELQNQYWKINNEAIDLEEIIATIKAAKEKIKHNEMDLKNMQKKFSELMPEVCPLCGSDLSKKTKQANMERRRRS